MVHLEDPVIDTLHGDQSPQQSPDTDWLVAKELNKLSIKNLMRFAPWLARHLGEEQQRLS
jgi:hypothetical protein